ncbi:hypothetical protein G3545_27640 [Starkeya sp. ORNL1]|uniref:hypothetical protein n=1 Tax=Starkeya sp. ORNL1 TaxID=2709380 RepID=UPI001463EEE6|nr:hypothetical protein [Starkeya sp. ORNL1]QJP17086.1 hypothetical protein G3545_27640 [Starkeya sp. ORNL1]
MSMTDDQATKIMQLLLSLDRPLGELMTLSRETADVALKKKLDDAWEDILQTQFEIIERMRSIYPHLKAYD